jgi:hypothetical protein
MDALHWWLAGTAVAGWALAFQWWRSAERSNLLLTQAHVLLAKKGQP